MLARLTLACGSGHYAGNLAEDRADAGRNARHDRARCERHEPRHESILDEILTASIPPDHEFPNQISDPGDF